MKHVLQIIKSMNQGGAENFTMNVYRNIDRTKIQFDFLLFKETNYFENEILEKGGKIFKLPPRNQGVIQFIRKLYQFFKKNAGHYDAIHVTVSSLSSIEPLLIGAWFRIPIRIIHAHNSQCEKGLKHLLLHWFSKLTVNWGATQGLACSGNAKDWVFSYTLLNKNAKIIKNGIDLKHFAFNNDIRIRKREELGVNPRDIVFGHAGRFVPEKNHSFILKVFRRIHQKNDNTRLLLVGNGINFDKVKKEAEQMNLSDSVSFLGIRPDVNELLQAMDAIVFPSVFEGLPVFLVEAQAAGLPLFISDKITKTVDVTGNVAFLNIDDEPEIWSDYILEKMPVFKREDTSQKIQQAGYSIADVVKELEKIYSNQL